MSKLQIKKLHRVSAEGQFERKSRDCQRPRLCVYRSNKHIYAIDDQAQNFGFNVDRGA